MLLKGHLRRFVKEVDMNFEGQIWLTLSFLACVKLGGVYIPPHDSPYFERSLWGNLAANAAMPGRYRTTTKRSAISPSRVREPGAMSW